MSGAPTLYPDPAPGDGNTPPAPDAAAPAAPDADAPEAPGEHRLSRRADRWNLGCNIADGALAIFAYTIVAPDFLLSPFLRRCGASDTLIGTLTAIVTFTTAFLPILAAHYVQRLRRKKPYVLVVGTFQRMHFFIVPLLAVLVLPVDRHLFFILYVASAMFGSAMSQAVWPGWTDLVAKVTPPDKRGLLWAGRNIGGLLLAILLSTQVRGLLNRPLGWWDLGPFNFAWNYGLVFLIAGTAFALSLGCIAFVRERGGQITTPPPGLGALFRLAPRVLARDRRFTVFLAAQGLLLIPAGMVGAFFALTAAKRFPGVKVEDVLGGYMTVSIICTVVGNVFFARLGDRRGHRMNLIAGAPLLMLACVWAMLAPDPKWYSLVYVFTGLSQAARAVSNIPMMMEFGGERDRTHYSAVFATVFNPLLAAGPFFGGALRDHIGLNAAFIIAIGFLVAGMLAMIFLVKDPRRM
jgi:MFS family permease